MITGEVLPPDVRLRERLGGDIWDRSAFHRNRLQRAGFRKGGLRSVSDLLRLPPMIIEDVASPSSIALANSKLAEKNKPDARYWPLQWLDSAGLPLGYSHQDLDLLGELGHQSLLAAGLRRSDVVAILLTTGPTREWWQFSLGARRAGISAVTLGPKRPTSDIEMLDPSVLLGGTRELARLLEAAGYDELPRVHTVIGVDDADKPVRDRLAALCADRGVTLVRAWAPDGALALWSQCRSGEAFHAWPDHEVCEVVDPLSGLPTPDGESGVAVWTGIGWYASAIVRLWTGASVKRQTELCPACGRTTPRFIRSTRHLGFAGVLEDIAEVKLWYAELQKIGGEDQLFIWLTPADTHHSLQVLESIAARIGPAQVFIVGVEELKQRIGDARGERFGDRRALAELDE